MQQPRFRTAVACRLASIDRDRFNEAIAAGNYPCAPRTDRGSTRVFDQNDLIALYYYGRLLNYGMTPRVAGYWACELFHAVKSRPDTDEVVLCFDKSELEHVMVSEDLEALEPERRSELLHGSAYFPIMQRVCVDVRAIRGLIKSEIERELAVIGPDDEGEA